MYRRRLWGVLGHQRLFSLYALGDLASKFGFEVEARFGGGYLPLFGGLSRVACRIDPWHAHFIGVKLRKPLSGGPCPGPYPPPPAP
jgi:hypothetical protein